MALSLIDRLLGRTEAKASLGPGAFSMTYGTPLHSFSRDPHRLMAEAQGLFRSNIWVNTAERAITNRLRSTPWHLEDENGDTVNDSSPEPYRAVLRLMLRPSTDMTRNRLWGITARHLGLCGNAFWFLDQRDLLAGTPLQMRYVNPARMTPATDPLGNITGWILDHPENQVLNRMGADYSRSGTPLTADEVVHFTLDDPDWGIWGVGIAEAAQRKIELDRLTETHAGGVLASGGRLSGLVSPKTGSQVNDDQWVQFVRDWRSITSDPDAAKRLQIAKMPLDFTQMTASPKDLQLADVQKANRDDILAGWQVPLSQIGIQTGRGLNSGETQKYEEAAMYQGAVQPRGDAIVETVQIKLLDRFADLGVKVKLVVEWPEFDDELPLYQNAEKAKVVPLTVDQRLEQVGKDPLDPAIYGKLGQAIFIDNSMVPLFNPTALSEPEPEEPPTEPDVATDAESEVVGKAASEMTTLRARVERDWTPKLQHIVANVLAEQRRLVTSKAEHLARKPSDTSWWNEQREQRRFMVALEPAIVDLAAEVAAESRQAVGPAAKADSFIERVLDAIRTAVGERITGINRTTRDKVQAAVKQAVELGESPADLGRRIRESAAFDEYRAELIARTETAQVYNDAALHSYNALEVTEVEAIDGDVDAACAARHGKRYPIEEAMGISDHPNGTLDWIPVVKAVVEPNPMLVMAEAFRAAMEQDRTPVINVHPAPVTVESPVINNYLPEQKPPVVNLPPAKASTKRVVRDDAGRISEVVEE